MTKPTFASVTEESCACGYLQSAADDPDSPIVFDFQLNEYNFEYPCAPGDGEGEGAKSMLRIYHCPFCGGAAPKSKRERLFAVISMEEEGRLREMFRGITTLDAALRILGKPTRDDPHGVTRKQEEDDGAPPISESFRTLVYAHLSETAEVHITDYRENGVAIRLQGKYIGPP